MLSPIDQSSAMFDDMFEADSGVYSIANCSLGPGGVDHFITFASIKSDLLYTTSSAALDSASLGNVREKCLQLFEVELLWVFDEPINLKFPVIWIDSRNTSMVTHKMEVCWGDDL